MVKLSKVSILVPPNCFTQLTEPFESSLATKPSASPALVNVVPPKVTLFLKLPLIIDDPSDKGLMS